MKLIWKEELNIDDFQELHIRKGYKFSEILTIQLQNGKPVVWFTVTEQLSEIWETDIVKIRVFCTGDYMPSDSSNLVYINTVQLLSGGYVAHFFKELK